MLRRITIVLLSLTTFGLLAVPGAFASRDLIVFKTNVPLEIPGRVIGPGTYHVLNLDTADDNGPIEIQNSKGQALGAYIAEPVERLNAPSHTVVDLQKQANAPARLKYFIPGGSDYGYRLEYPTPAVPATKVAKAVLNSSANG